MASTGFQRLPQHPSVAHPIPSRSAGLRNSHPNRKKSWKNTHPIETTNELYHVISLYSSHPISSSDFWIFSPENLLQAHLKWLRAAGCPAADRRLVASASFRSPSREPFDDQALTSGWMNLGSKKCGKETHSKPIGSMVLPYMVTFTINIPQMLAYIPYMDPMGNEKSEELIQDKMMKLPQLLFKKLFHHSWSNRQASLSFPNLRLNASAPYLTTAGAITGLAGQTIGGRTAMVLCAGLTELGVMENKVLEKSWLVVSTPLKNISQLGLLFPIYGENWRNKKCSKPPTR